MSLEPLTETTSDERAAATLQNVRQKMGFIPNMLGVMAHAPAVLESYLDLTSRYDSSSLTPAERQIVLLAVSQYNACDYCLAAHSMIARKQGVSPQTVEAVREGRELADSKHEALRQFTLAMVRTSGRPSDAERQAFHDAGYSEAQILEVVLGIALKTLSNYTNHMMDPEIDKVFARAA